jgi:hypothetical protein
LPSRHNGGLLKNLIFERHALGIILREPFLRSILIGENLEMVNVADLATIVDVDPDLLENASLTLPIAGCCRFLTLIQLGERPGR